MPPAREKYQKAIEDFTVDISMTPDSWAAIKKRGVAYFFVSEYEKALKDLRKARELRPQDLSTLIWIGAKNVAACRDEEFKQGLLKLADEAVARPDSDKATAHRYRAELLAAMGRPEETSSCAAI